jgi:hypothetical protein
MARHQLVTEAKEHDRLAAQRGAEQQAELEAGERRPSAYPTPVRVAPWLAGWSAAVRLMPHRAVTTRTTPTEAARMSTSSHPGAAGTGPDGQPSSPATGSPGGEQMIIVV